ncbi:SdpI family protein [Arthrobacter sp. zg-ZUI100]|uniref:SdpI family protein n=1 Tax=Arthrobacter jiangjiafuii TaxID=2817475 RepID=UPI001AEF30E4|nr:SdpI family protein [Arthrobacter jiangjiafuii]
MSEELGGLISLSFALVLLPGICIAVTRQAAEGLVGINGSFGIRTRYTRASDDAWVAGHRAALPVVKAMWPVAGVGLAAAVIVHISFGGSAGTGVAFLALMAEVAVVLRSAAVANRAAKAAGEPVEGRG